MDIGHFIYYKLNNINSSLLLQNSSSSLGLAGGPRDCAVSQNQRSLRGSTDSAGEVPVKADGPRFCCRGPRDTEINLSARLLKHEG